MADDWTAAGLRPVNSNQEVSAAPSGDDWAAAGLRPMNYTNSEKRGALAKGAASGIQQGGMALMGANAGGLIGSGLGPGGAVAGYLLGGTGGYLLGSILSEATTGNEDSVPEGLRPWYAGGEIFASGAPLAFNPLGAAKLGVSFRPTIVGNFLNSVINSAKNNPLAFVASEMSGLGGSAVAGGLSENYLPGNPISRFGAEVIGGFFNPGRLFLSSASALKFGIAKILHGMSKTGRETEAQKVLLGIIEQAGEDPAAMVALLKDPSITGLTAAQKTGSVALAAIEAKLAKSNIKFGSKASEMAQDGMAAIESQIALLRRTGDPQALRLAAQGRQRQYRSMLTNLVKNAESDAITAARNISSDTPAARSEISRNAREALEEVLVLARKAESELWDKIPDDVTTSALPLTRVHKNIRARMIQEEPFPKWVDDFMDRLKSQRYSVTAAELKTARSRFLANSRQAAGGSNPNWNEARIYGELADGALEALSNASSRKIPPFVVDDARSFSKALNDTFSRSFAGNSLGRSASGADRLPPELTLRAALASGNEAGALKFSELSEATKFMDREGVDSAIRAASDESIAKMQNAQERFLRLTAAEAIDPSTGRVSKARLSGILQRNAELFDRFPEAKAAVETALKTEKGLQDITRITTQGNRIVDQKAAFSKLANVENPSEAFARALNGATPAKDIRAMAKLARRGGDDAVAGLKASAVEYLLSQAGERFNPDRLSKALLEPSTPGGSSLADMLVSEKVLDKGDIDRIGKLLESAKNISSSSAARADLLEQAEEMDGLTTLILQVQGAKLGTLVASHAPGGGSGHQLIAASAGSKFLRNLFKKMDVQSLEKVLVEASLNPPLMAALLEKPATKGKALSLGRQIHAYLLNAGFSFSANGQFSSEDRASAMER